jgi:hypothetical protein
MTSEDQQETIAWPQLRDLAAIVDDKEPVERERDDEKHPLCPCYGHGRGHHSSNTHRDGPEQLVRTSLPFCIYLLYLFLVSNYCTKYSSV